MPTKRKVMPRRAATRRAPKPPSPVEDPVALARDDVRRNARDIVQAIIHQAREGRYMDAKFLFDFAGIGAALSDVPPDEGPSLAALLLRRLEDDANHSGTEHSGKRNDG